VEMPPRSVCLNVFTSSLGDTGAAVREDGGLNNMIPAVMQRRDSAQSGMSLLRPFSMKTPSLNSNRACNVESQLTIAPDMPRRSSNSSIVSAPTPSSSSPIPAFQRTDIFNTLRPMASTESMNISLSSKRTFHPCGLLQEPDCLPLSATTHMAAPLFLCCHNVKQISSYQNNAPMSIIYAECVADFGE
jgi:hypothetical protein